MPEKVPEKNPAPVDVKASIPLEIKVAPESIEALGGDATKPRGPVLPADAALPLPVIITEEQHPIPVVITAPDGVTPVPVPSLGVAENTAPGASGPVSGYTPDAVPPAAFPVAATGTPGQGTTTTTVTSTVPPAVMVTKEEGLTLAPTTTAADDEITKGQRLTSFLWESTQATISVAITLAVIYCAIAQIASETITNAFFFIVATYFTRTNHTKVGGVGPKNGDGVYRGR